MRFLEITRTFPHRCRDRHLKNITFNPFLTNGNNSSSRDHMYALLAHSSTILASISQQCMGNCLQARKCRVWPRAVDGELLRSGGNVDQGYGSFLQDGRSGPERNGLNSRHVVEVGQIP
jgi:hypothetical protein